MDDRGVTTVVGKSLELLIVVGYVALVSGLLYGTVVPTARDVGGTARGEQLLVRAGSAIEDAVPQTGVEVAVTARVQLPNTIQGQPYTLRFQDGFLVLDHPDGAVAGTLPVSLPDRVVAVQGSWNGSADAVVSVRSTADGIVVTLAEAPT